MRSSPILPAVSAVFSTAVLLVALIFLSPSTLMAADRGATETGPALAPPTVAEPSGTPPSTADEAGTSQPVARPRARPPALTNFDDYDAIAALDAIRIALTEVGDGGTYIWHRRNGRVSGTMKPTASFKSTDGRPCRHIVVTLQARERTKSTEGVACRLVDGRWQLEG